MGDIRRTLEPLSKLAFSARLLLPSHGETRLPPLFVFGMAREFQRVAHGGAEYWLEEACWGRICVYLLDGSSLCAM